MEKVATPVKRGQRISLALDSLAPGGEAVGRHEGFTVFVPGGVPGDVVTAEIISTKPTYGRALIKQIDSPSPWRVEPRCPIAQACGGCHWQQVGYPKQLEEKHRQVVAALRRIGRLPEAEQVVKPIIGAETPYQYRNKAAFPVGRRGRYLILGYYQPKSHDLVEVDKCHVLPDPLNRVARKVNEILNDHRLTAFDEKSGKGLMRHVVVRFSYASGKVLVGLVTNGPLPKGEDIAADIMGEDTEVAGVLNNIQTAHGNVIFGPRTELLAGVDCLVEVLDGLRFQIGLTSFFQINPPQAARLYREISRLAGLTGTERVIDAYAGTGTIALWLAREAGEVIAIEEHPQAVEDAIENANLNLIANCTFERGTVETHLARVVADGCDLLVLDPPRAGCAPEVIEAARQARKIVYVSCHPATLARDIRLLIEQGFVLDEVVPIDMFPHTHHVESVALLKRAVPC